MHRYILEACRAAAEQAYNVIGPPAAVPYPAVTEAGQPCNPVGIGCRAGHGPLHRLRELGSDPLVRIDGQYPLTSRQIEGAVSLRTEAGPVGREGNARAMRLGNLPRAVCAARVDHDDLFG